jgi:hypothetical protein
LTAATVPTPQLQAQFLELLPRLRAQAQGAFRFLRCPHRRDDATAEVVALCWSWFVRLAERGRDPVPLAGALVHFATRRVRSGRRLCGQETTKDVASWRAQRGRGFAVRALPEPAMLSGSALEEALHDNSMTPVPEQVVFRLDWPAWLGTLSPRDRDLLRLLALGYSTLETAQQCRLSPARVSQKRREFRTGWEHFGGGRAERRPPRP